MCNKGVICDEWLNFEIFVVWYYDNITPECRFTHILDLEYSPKTCAFIPKSMVNLFTRRPHRGLPTGVRKVGDTFEARFAGRSQGGFITTSDASNAYLLMKGDEIRRRLETLTMSTEARHMINTYLRLLEPGKPPIRKGKNTVKNAAAYGAWKSMQTPKKHGAMVCYEWLDFDKFAEWYNTNNMEGCRFTLIIEGDYSPKTCAFIPYSMVNSVQRQHHGSGEFPTGVQQTSTRNARYRAAYGGQFMYNFHTVSEAYDAYKSMKADRIRFGLRTMDMPDSARHLLTQYADSLAVSFF